RHSLENCARDCGCQQLGKAKAPDRRERLAGVEDPPGIRSNSGAAAECVTPNEDEASRSRRARRCVLLASACDQCIQTSGLDVFCELFVPERVEVLAKFVRQSPRVLWR